MPAHELDDKSTLNFGGLLLYMAFATFNRGVFVTRVTKSSFEHGEESLSLSCISQSCLVDLAIAYFIVQLAGKSSTLRSSTIYVMTNREIELVLVEEQILLEGERSKRGRGSIDRAEDKLECRTYQSAFLIYFLDDSRDVHYHHMPQEIQAPQTWPGMTTRYRYAQRRVDSM